jgi:hypothetical protein
MGILNCRFLWFAFSSLVAHFALTLRHTLAQALLILLLSHTMQNKYLFSSEKQNYLALKIAVNA